MEKKIDAEDRSNLLDVIVESGYLCESISKFLSFINEDIGKEKLEDFKEELERYYTLMFHQHIKLIQEWQDKKSKEVSEEDLLKIENFRQEFIEKISNDLNWSEGLAVLWKMVKSNIPPYDKLEMITDFDKVLGLNLIVKAFENKIKIPLEVNQLVKERENLRKSGDWQKADEIRKKIESLGWMIKDTAEGTKTQRFN